MKRTQEQRLIDRLLEVKVGQTTEQEQKRASIVPLLNLFRVSREQLQKAGYAELDDLLEAFHDLVDPRGESRRADADLRQRMDDIQAEIDMLGANASKAVDQNLRWAALAYRLLHDLDWLDHFEGSDAAEDYLAKMFFGDSVGGTASLAYLMEIFRIIPDVEQWRQANFNTKILWKQCKKRHPSLPG